MNGDGFVAAFPVVDDANGFSGAFGLFFSCLLLIFGTKEWNWYSDYLSCYKMLGKDWYDIEFAWCKVSFLSWWIGDWICNSEVVWFHKLVIDF